MSAFDDVTAKLLARINGQPTPVRSTYAIVPDPPRVIGIATIKVVTEDHVQAIAYGQVDGPPQIATRVHPLGRDTSDIQGFAEWLCAQVDAAQADGAGIRVWVPHEKTIDTLAVLGRRYQRNASASAELRQAAVICRALVAEARQADQQLVAVGRSVLLEHASTGQSAVEDAHAGSVLAWFETTDPNAVVAAARAAARLPAAGVLPNAPGNMDDAEVERLRAEWKRATPAVRRSLETRISLLLSRAVTDEWILMQRLRTALWRLSLEPACPTIYSRDLSRFFRHLSLNAFTPVNLVPTASMLNEREFALTAKEEADLFGDPVARAKARAGGKVLTGRVSIQQAVPNRNPCFAIIETEQTELRLRQDSTVKSVEHGVVGTVRSIQPAGSNFRVTLELKNSARNGHRLDGLDGDWCEVNDFPAYLREKPGNGARERGGWLVSGQDPSVVAPVALPENPIATLEALR